jgi:ComF family protein
MNNWLKNNQKLKFNALFQHLFQQHCVLCTALTKNEHCICQACIDDLPLASDTCCPQCGLSSQGEVCGRCLKQPPHFDSTKALFTYTFPADALLQHYKYSHALYLSETLATLFSENLLNTTCDVIIPMPLHPTRLKERGFNQSLEVAKVVSTQMNIPVDSKSCIRIKNTAPQASLPLKERLKNMRGAFEIKQNLIQNHLKGKHIAIIDDVMTTGTSLNELAKTLKQAGAKQVDCWVIARAKMD